LVNADTIDIDAAYVGQTSLRRLELLRRHLNGQRFRLTEVVVVRRREWISLWQWNLSVYGKRNNPNTAISGLGTMSPEC
jgi:hypothetical protein